MPSRTHPQKRRKPIASSRLFLVGFIILILLILAGFIQKILKTSIWDGERRVSMVLDTRPLLLVSLEPIEKQVTVISISEDSYLNVPIGYGPYKAGSIYELGELENQKNGGKLLEKTMEDTFGIPVDGYIGSTEHVQIPTGKDRGTTFTQVRHIFLNWGTLLQTVFFSKHTINTNFSPLDMMRLIMAASSIRQEQTRVLDLAAYEISSPSALADGSLISVIDPDRLDKNLEGTLAEKEMIDDGVSVSVFNASGLPGIATKVARTINNMGSRVFVVSNSDRNEKNRCTIILSSEKFKNRYTLKRLSTVFGCEQSNAIQENLQSDIAILIGESFIKL